ncbi:MAG: hypothetical protein AABM66_01260 [Actinomycetota bacterium]
MEPRLLVEEEAHLQIQSARPAAISARPSSTGNPAATPPSPQPISGPSPAIRMAAGTAIVTVPGSSAIARA